MMRWRSPKLPSVGLQSLARRWNREISRSSGPYRSRTVGRSSAPMRRWVPCCSIGTSGSNDGASHDQATALLHKLRERLAAVPVFLLADRELPAASMTIEVAEMVESSSGRSRIPQTSSRVASSPRSIATRHSSCHPMRACSRTMPASRTFLVGTGTPGRHRLHQASGRTRLFRLPGRECVPHRYGDRARRARLTARPYRAGRRSENIRRGSSGPIAAIRASSAPRARTAASCRHA